MQRASTSWPRATWFGWPSSRSALLFLPGPKARDARGVGGRKNGASKRLKTFRKRSLRRAAWSENDVWMRNLAGDNFWSEKRPVLQQPARSVRHALSRGKHKPLTRVIGTFGFICLNAEMDDETVP